MANLPKPLIGLLLGTVAFFAIWMVALKPSSSSSSSGGSPSGAGQYQSAINRAHQAVTTSSQANAKLGAPTATAPAAKPATPAKTAKTVATPTAKPVAKPATKAAPAAKSARSADQSTAAGVKAVQDAVQAHRVVAVLFYNPAAADDRSMKSELAQVPTEHGQLVKLAVPVSELTQFAMITAQVPVVTSPTLVIINQARHASTLTGWASVREIAARIYDAANAN